jgi:predicted ABC-type ATPase
MDVQKISNDIATLKRAVKSAATASLKDKLKKKVASLTQVLKDANIPAKKLAMMLLGAKRKVASYTQAEFNEVIKRLSYKAEYSFLKGLTKVEVKDDLKREAKTPGWRFKGRNNFKTPTKSDLINDMGKPYSKRKTYYESRSNRSDVTRPALLETGGGLEEQDFDLFEDFDNLPKNIQDIFFEYEDSDDTYERNEEMLSRLKPLGYTFDYGLDATPYGLKKMEKGGEVKKGDIVIWENKKYKLGKEDKEIKNFYLLNMDGTYAQNPNGSSLKVHKSRLKKMAHGGGLNYKAQNFLDTIRISDRSIQLKDITVEGTPKGNWKVYHKGKSLMTVNGNLLNEETIDKYDLRHDEFAKGGTVEIKEGEDYLYGRVVGKNYTYTNNKIPNFSLKIGIFKEGKSPNNHYAYLSVPNNVDASILTNLLNKSGSINNSNNSYSNQFSRYNLSDDEVKTIINHFTKISGTKKMGHGGLAESKNKEMVLNNAQQIEHHAEELENAASKAKHIPAWVVAKIYNASSNISDATHYLEGVNTMPKEQYERIHAEIENNKMETGGGLNSFLDMQMAVSKICKSNGCTIKDYYLAEKKYSAGGGIGGTFDSSSTGVGIGGTDSSSKTGTPIGGTAASSMAKGGAVVGAKFKHDGKEFEVKKVQDGAVYTTNGKVYSLKTLESFGVTFNKERAKSNKPRGIRGERREEMEYQLEDLKNDLRYAKQDLRDVKRDMEEDAGEKGDNWIDADANRYGEQMNFIEEQIEALEKQIAEKEERLSYAKGGGVGETCEIFDSNGERAIDSKSIEKLTKCVTALPQTKSSNIDTNGNYTKERQKLHKEIIDKFKKDVVCIKKGKPIAVLMGGSPASGKSTFLKKYRPYLLSDSLFKVDADEIRAELPEYKGWNATQTHEETGNIVDILISDRNVGIPCKFDFVFDGTMSSTKRYKILINNLRKEGYDIYIVFMGNIPKEEIKERALERYKKSGRFVPMFVIEDFYANGEKNLKELKSMVDGYIVVDGSSYDYKIIEQGGKKLPNKRLYEKLGEKIKLKTGGGVQQPSYAIKLSELLNKYEPTLIGISRGMVQVTPSMAYSGAELSNMFKGFGDSMDIKNIVYKSLRDKDSYPIVEKLTKGKYKLIKPTWSDNFEDYYFDNITKKEKGGGTKKEFIAKKVGKVMREFKEGDLHIGTSNKIVKNPKQAIAIGLSEGKRGWKHKNKS